MQVVQFDKQPTLNVALDVVSVLQNDLRAGKVSAFLVAAVTDEDGVISYSGSTRPVSRLRLQGATVQALAALTAGEVG